MRVTLIRAFPVPLKQAFDYLVDFTTWPAWYAGVIRIFDRGESAWSEPGDTVRLVYKILGRKIEGLCTLDEIREPEYLRFTAAAPSVGDVRQEWFFGDGDDGAFTLKVIMETEEPTNFFGTVIDRMVVPRVLERDLRQTLDHLEDTFAVGIPE